jgi:type II secretory pathway pseudopilin PulG
MKREDLGMGLLAAVALLTIIGLSLAIAVPAVFQVIASDNTLKTSLDLQSLRNAITGNANLIIEGGRADFGFVGTMGNVPLSSLSELWIGPSDLSKVYHFDDTKAVGAGWVGPYVPSMFADDLIALDKDRFGNRLDFQLNPPLTAREDMAPIAVRIRSSGPDGVKGNGDDMFVDILKAEIFATVKGKLLRGTQPVVAAAVTLNRPSDGVVSTAAATTNDLGEFTFSDVPFGFRSVSVDPKLTYEPGSASVQGGNALRFTLTNFATNAVNVDTLTATWTCPPANPPVTGYYETIRFGNNNVFDYVTNNTVYPGVTPAKRIASGVAVTFNPRPQTVDGSGKPSQVIPIRVDKETTTTPDLKIGGVGRSVTIQLQNFKKDLAGSSNNNFNPSGCTFTIHTDTIPTGPNKSDNTFLVP